MEAPRCSILHYGMEWDVAVEEGNVAVKEELIIKLLWNRIGELTTFIYRGDICVPSLLIANPTLFSSDFQPSSEIDAA